MSDTSFTLKMDGKSPFVVLPLEQYERLMEYIEELEDRTALITRQSEDDVEWSAIEKKFNKKFGAK
jgi:hypothetical protein